MSNRWLATYHLTGDEKVARAKAKDICVEQTVEFPIDLIPKDSYIFREIVGRVESFGPAPDGKGFIATISFDERITGGELPQFLNAVFGNISIKPGIRLIGLKPTEGMSKSFGGPRFGRDGLRRALNAYDRPILCAIVKPMGLSSDELADMAYRFALGGIDIVKDDHSLANQPFSEFEERVEKCAAAVAKANRESGHNAIYMPSLIAPAGEIEKRARFAKEAGAGGFLVAPGIIGFDTMRFLADSIGLPLLAHASFLGSFVTSQSSGIAPSVLFGTLMRLAGADAANFPNYAGRFSFSKKECGAIARADEEPMGQVKPIFPAPGGGVTLSSLPEMHRFYGDDVLFLIGSDLYRIGPDLVENARRYREMAEKIEPAKQSP